MTGNEATGRHVPVLLEEVLEGLDIRQGGVYLDGTIGSGGHSLRILERYPDVRVLGLDRDPEALEAAARVLAPFGARVRLFHTDFRRVEEVLGESGTERIDGMLLDLGVSSMQLEDAGRGFSFSREGPLDMRMDPGRPISAADIVNTWPREELARALFTLGEERLSRQIASAIERERTIEPIVTTQRLAGIVASVPGMSRVRNIHPATRTFQALRIAVNDELAALEEAVPAGARRLTPGGRLAVISFHSLEDRIVKRAFRELENPCRCPKEFPQCRCGRVSAGRVVTRKPVTPSEEEVRANPRSRSAKLRIFEKGRG